MTMTTKAKTEMAAKVTPQKVEDRAAKNTLLFIDEIEDDVARLLLDTRSFTVPTALLPDGVHEGQWVSLAVVPAADPPDKTTDRRQRLGADDPGGNIKL